jgi:hypothetical protein
MRLFKRQSNFEESSSSSAPKPAGRRTRVIRIILGGLIALVSIAPLRIAFGFFRLGVRSWFGHPYYLCNDAFFRSGDWLLVGLVIVLPAAYYAVRPRASALWLVLSFFVAFGTLEQIPEHVLPEMLISQARDILRDRALNLATGLENSGGLLPASQVQLASVAKMAARQGDLELSGPYFRGGARVPVQLAYVGAATGPLVAMPAHPLLPAAIYCAVSPGRKRFWITVSMLDRRVGGHPRLLEDRTGGPIPMVINGSLSATPSALNRHRRSGEP